MQRHRYHFRVKTRSGQVVGNIVVEAHDQYEAEQKLRQRYPDCTILGCQVN